jgi:hypothetical protein
LEHYNSLINNFNEKKIFSGIVKFDEKKIKSSNFVRYKDERHRRLDFIYRQKKNLSYYNFVSMNMSFNKNIDQPMQIRFDDNYASYGLDDTQFAVDMISHGYSLDTTNATIIHQESTSIDLFYKKYKHFSQNYFFKFYTNNSKFLSTYQHHNYKKDYLLIIARLYYYLDSKLSFIRPLLFALSKIFSLLSYLLILYLKISDRTVNLYSFSIYRLLTLFAILSSLLGKRYEPKDFM